MMHQPQGLAQAIAGQPKGSETPAEEQQEAQHSSMSIEQIIEALLKGVDPQELLKQGVPPELLKQAIEAILASQQGQPKPQSSGEGLEKTTNVGQ